jgi:hypothetical protein
MPGEQRGRRHSEDLPAGTGKKSAECSEQGPVSWLLRRTSDLTAEDGQLVAQGEQLDVLGAVGTSHKDDELEQASDGDISKGPDVASGVVPSH